MEQYDEDRLAISSKNIFRDERDKEQYKPQQRQKHFIHQKRFHEEAKFLVQLIRGLKNISEMIEPDPELKKLFFV
jgi:hypothetical protein